MNKDFSYYTLQVSGRNLGNIQRLNCLKPNSPITWLITWLLITPEY
ncbi:MAG: hypothetical protein HC908_04640 [Calothrix sp. SM1_7_51]|nr:hypothetical protein [Calothrix sp. SM1_7_51]